jgi:6-pyruvoyltetrahydropterin/6-carboxytetrahydropterin synthase
MLYVTKAIEFSATHRLFNPEFDQKTNEKVFGKCNNLNGHGHNYRLEVTVKGTPDPKTGMAFDLTKLREILEEEVMEHFDHKNLNLDVPMMKGLVPTAENIARVLWKLLEKRFGPGKLHQIRLYETQNNIIDYRGEE